MVYKEFVIRQSSNGDIPFIKEIVFTVLLEYGLKPDELGKDNDLNDIDNNYNRNNGFFGIVVNTMTNKMVGTFGVFQIDVDTCELRKMYLVKESRGRGLGKFILDYSINIAREKGYKKIILETVSPLVEAISLYKHRGFQEVKPKEINDRVDKAFQLDIST